MSLNPKSLQINKIVYYSIENKPILIFLKDVRCEAQTPVYLKERVRESLGTYSPRPGTGASQNGVSLRDNTLLIAIISNKTTGMLFYLVLRTCKKSRLSLRIRTWHKDVDKSMQPTSLQQVFLFGHKAQPSLLQGLFQCKLERCA